MIPFLGILKGLPWRLIGYVSIGIFVLILGWRIASWRHGYLQLGEAKAALRDERQDRADDAKTYTANIVKAEKEAQALAHDLGEIRTRFANMVPIVPKTLIRTVEVPIAPGQTTCPSPRISPDFVRVFNAAGTP